MSMSTPRFPKNFVSMAHPWPWRGRGHLCPFSSCQCPPNSDRDKFWIAESNSTFESLSIGSGGYYKEQLADIFSIVWLSELSWKFSKCHSEKKDWDFTFPSPSPSFWKIPCLSLFWTCSRTWVVHVFLWDLLNSEFRPTRIWNTKFFLRVWESETRNTGNVHYSIVNLT